MTTKFRNLALSVIYRPPPSNKNCLSIRDFFDDWSAYLALKAVSPSSPIITGDLNFHVDDSQDANANRFKQTLHASGFTQHVVGPTHKKGHTLDVVLTLENDSIMNSVTVMEPGLFDRHGKPACDHQAIVFYPNISKPSRES